MVVGHRWIIHGGRSHQPFTPTISTSVDLKSDCSEDETEIAAPADFQIPLGDVWSYNFLTRRWKLLRDRPVEHQEDKSEYSIFCQPSRWGHQIQVGKSDGTDDRQRRFFVVTGGISLAPISLYWYHYDSKIFISFFLHFTCLVLPEDKPPKRPRLLPWLTSIDMETIENLNQFPMIYMIRVVDNAKIIGWNFSIFIFLSCFLVYWWHFQIFLDQWKCLVIMNSPLLLVCSFFEPFLFSLWSLYSIPMKISSFLYSFILPCCAICVISESTNTDLIEWRLFFRSLNWEHEGEQRLRNSPRNSGVMVNHCIKKVILHQLVGLIVSIPWQHEWYCSNGKSGDFC